MHGYCAYLSADRGTRCWNAAVVEPRARRLCDFYGWIIADGRAGSGTGASESKRLSPGGRSAAEARNARDDVRRTIEAPEGIDRRARPPGGGRKSSRRCARRTREALA